MGVRGWVLGRKDSDYPSRDLQYPSRPSAQVDVIKGAMARVESRDLLEAWVQIPQERPKRALVGHVIMV